MGGGGWGNFKIMDELVFSLDKRTIFFFVRLNVLERLCFLGLCSSDD